MLNWIDDSSFEMDGYRLTLDYAFGGSLRPSTAKDFTMMKSRDFLDSYVALRDQGMKRILEVGVYQGGSFVFLDRLLKPEKISAVELSTKPIPALDEYITRHKDRARLHYGTSQDDVARLTEIVQQDFGGELDLVVDDASHFYEPTKTTFATVFPKVRPGGIYIIEDWSWGFQDAYQDETNGWYGQKALANLFIDLVEDMVLGPMIENIQITRPMIKIRRSSTPAGAVFTRQARRGRTFNPL